MGKLDAGDKYKLDELQLKVEVLAKIEDPKWGPSRQSIARPTNARTRLGLSSRSTLPQSGKQLEHRLEEFKRTRL